MLAFLTSRQVMSTQPASLLAQNAFGTTPSLSGCKAALGRWCLSTPLEMNIFSELFESTERSSNSDNMLGT